MSQRSRLLALALVLCFGACACRSSEREPSQAQASANTSATPSASAPKPPPPAPKRKPAAPPVTPAASPQLVACGERDFYRISRSALEVFEIAEHLPPPQIRGSRVARQTNEIALDEPLNVFSIAKKSVLAIGKGEVLRYDLAGAKTRRYAAIPTSGPFVAWPVPRRADAFRVHGAGRANVEEYSLAGLPRSDADSPKKPPKVDELPGFDARLFTVLADGTPLYSMTGGVARLGAALPRTFAMPSDAASSATALFADASPNRYWTADASGGLGLWTLKEDPRTAAAKVPGVVIDSARDGERVAVLSMELTSHGYQPTVTIFANAKQQGQLKIASSFANQGQPNLDFCLIAGRPWVLIGGTRWLQLLDWETRRLLAEW